MISNSNYIRFPQIHQRRFPPRRVKKRETLLAQGCRGPITRRNLVYLATPLDQFLHTDYRRIRDLVAAHFPARQWAIFEPARCNWTTPDWLKVWPRLVRWIDALVIWPREDGTVGFGVYQEACDIDGNGKPIYVMKVDGLKSFRGFRLLRSGSFRFARVRTGGTIKLSNLHKGGV